MKSSAKWGGGCVLAAAFLVLIAFASYKIVRFNAFNRAGVVTISREDMQLNLVCVGESYTESDSLCAAIGRQPKQSVVSLRVFGRRLTETDCRIYASIGSLVRLELYACEVPDGGVSRIVSGNPDLQEIWLEGSRCDLAPVEAIVGHGRLRSLSVYQSSIPRPQVQAAIDSGLLVIQSRRR